jgi:hypothetical protein
MRLKSAWNRRGFLGTAAALAASVLAPRKLFSSSQQAHGRSAVVPHLARALSLTVKYFDK